MLGPLRIDPIGSFWVQSGPYWFIILLVAIHFGSVEASCVVVAIP